MKSNSISFLLKLSAFLIIPFVYMIFRSQYPFLPGWILPIYMLLFYRYSLKDEFISKEKKYLNYLKQYFRIENTQLTLNTINYVFNKNHNKLNEIYNNNMSNLCIRFLYFQKQILVEKDYSSVDELVQMEGDAQNFGDIQYLILQCYKSNNDKNKFLTLLSRYNSKNAFLFKDFPISV